MSEIVVKEFNNQELLKQQLDEKLKFWGVPENFIIEEDAVGAVLAALSADDVLSVYIDKEQGLCINYSGEGYNGSEDDFIPNVSV